MKLYELESEEAKRKEDEAHPGPPYEIAARKAPEALGLKLSEERLRALATYGFLYSLGIGWGPTYAFLRR